MADNTSLVGRAGGAFLAVLAMVTLVSACGSGSASSPSPTASTHARNDILGKGDVTAVSASSITIVSKSGKAQTFALAPAVVVREAGRMVPLSTLATGERVVLYAETSSGNGPAGTPTVGAIKISTAKTPPSPTPSAS